MRYGRQDPPVSYILPFERTRGQSAIDAYEQADGYKALDWQKRLILEIMAVNNEDLWTHMKFGLAVPRRNGKNEVILMRELAGLINGEHILHTAHRTDTSHVAYERLLDHLEKAGIRIKGRLKAFGKEHIELYTGGVIDFRTRTSSGGLGTGYDLLVIDEAQEYTLDQESSLKYVVSSSRNPQTILTGTPPTVVSRGTVFKSLRKAVLTGERDECGWAEWSVEEMTDPKNIDAWYEANPSLGYLLTERIIKDEITNDELDFNIQRLGYWTTQNLKSEVSKKEWQELQCETMPELTGKLFVGIKTSALPSVSVCIASKTTDDKVFVEAVDCRSTRDGYDWIIRLIAQPSVEKVCIDGKGDADVLIEEIRRAGLKKPIKVQAGEYISAMAMFRNAISGSTLCHTGQPSLGQSVTNSEKRAIGTAGGYGFKSLKVGVDVSLMESAGLAYWLCSTQKQKKKQVIRY